jgi:alpha-mannosidase
MKRIFHVISNTHWDREWRYPYQKNRQMLVKMMDNLLDILENEPDYKAFHLDSQSVVLTDYLEIRPEKKAQISQYVNEKRLFIGPWFILPDEFMVSGENLIRNLLLGHKICREFGRVSKVGYSPFSWGQISQLPQIYTGFGIDVIMFYRGINSLDSPKAEFLWEGADGTVVLASRFSTMPRYNFYFYVYRPVIHNETPDMVAHPWDNHEISFHLTDPERVGHDYAMIEAEDGYYKENIRPWVQKLIDEQVNDFTTPHVIWMEGHDSSGPNRKTPKIIRDIQKMMPEVDVRHSTLEDYVAGLKADADPKTLSRVKGERRSAQFDRRSGNLYGYITSARMYLKQANFQSERLLEKYAEPFNTLAGIYGLNIGDEYLNIAWRKLLENSAHDSIGGCSLDTVHADMMNRYKQINEIADGVFERACQYLARQLDLSHAPAHSIHIHALNPVQFKTDGPFELYVDIPEKYDKGSVKLVDNQGEEVHTVILERSPSEPVLEQLEDRPMYYKMIRYRILADMPAIPSFGLRSFQAVPVLQQGTPPVRFLASKGGRIIENEFLRVEIGDNGTFTLIDKAHETRYSGLGYFIDEGEAGHAWVHEPVKPFGDSRLSTSFVTIRENNWLRAIVEVEYELEIPENLDERRHGIHSAVMPVTLTLTLSKGSRRLDLNAEVDNPAEDHRLRILFPTGLYAKIHFAEGQFDVVERPVQRPDTSDWVEQPMYDYPLYHFAGVKAGKKGLSILVDGLKEYEIMDDTNHTLALTLFRAFHYVIQPASKQDYEEDKGSQCLGKSVYRFALMPHEGDWQTGGVYAEAMRKNYPPVFFQTGRTRGKLKTDFSFLELDNGNVIVSAVKESDDRTPNTYILRLYNPARTRQTTFLDFAFPVKNIEKTTLEENTGKKLRKRDGKWRVTLNSREIMTLKIITKS